MRDSIVATYQGSLGPLTPQLRAELLDSLNLPAYLPPVSAAVIGTEGSVWLRRYDDGEGWTTWAVLDPSGFHRANVRAPAALRIMAYDGVSVWGTLRGELDVPYVVRYAIRGRR